MSKILVESSCSSASTHRMTQPSTTLNRRYVRRPANIAVEEAARAAVEEARAAELDRFDEEADEFDMLQRLEDIKAHALQLAEHNMEQTVMVLRGWMKNEAKAAIRA